MGDTEKMKVVQFDENADTVRPEGGYTDRAAAMDAAVAGERVTRDPLASISEIRKMVDEKIPILSFKKDFRVAYILKAAESMELDIEGYIVLLEEFVREKGISDEVAFGLFFHMIKYLVCSFLSYGGEKGYSSASEFLPFVQATSNRLGYQYGEMNLENPTFMHTFSVIAQYCDQQEDFTRKISGQWEEIMDNYARFSSILRKSTTSRKGNSKDF